MRNTLTPEDFLVEAFAGLARLVVSPWSRTFWAFLAVSLLLAWWVRRRERRAGVALPPHRDVFSGATWGSRSAMNDYWLVLANAAIFAVPIAALVPHGETLARAIADALRSQFPAFASAPAAWVPAALALVLFVADDFVRWAVHRAEHRVPVLWELHKVHHSAEVLNFITAERHHPLSLAVFQGAAVSSAAAINGVFLWAFGDGITVATLLGANVFWVLGNCLAGALRHSPAWLSFGPRIERWLISPAQHQIHHSIDPRHHGANFGGTLAIWDRLAGTLYVTTSDREPIDFGLGEETARYRTVPALLWRPLVAAFGTLRFSRAASR